MKRVPAIIAWIGVAIVLGASWPTLVISYEWIVRPQTAGRVTEGVIVSVALGILGLLPAAIGGFFSRSKAVAWGIIIAGAVYLLAFIPWVILGNNEWLFALLPGAWCLVNGFALLTTRHRGWWFAAVFALPIAVIAGTAGISALINAPVYQPVPLQPPAVGSGELTLTIEPTGGYYRLVTTEADGSTREHLRLWVQGAGSTYVQVSAPGGGKLMMLPHTNDVPLGGIAVPPIGQQFWVYADSQTGPWRLEPRGNHGRLIEYHEGGAFSFNAARTCVSYTKRGEEERYVIFRLKEHVPGERMVIEYRYAQPATP